MSLKRVPPEGNPNASLMIVGEAPGADEVRYGKPFKGFAGRRLNQWLASAGIDRRSCWITNVVKVQPPGNKYGRLEELGVSESDFIPELVEEIRQVRPHTIVALGNNPMRVLTGYGSGILRRRGSFYPCTLVPEVNARVLVMIHPAARIFNSQPELNVVCAADMRKVSQNSPNATYGTDIIIEPTFEQAVETLKNLPDPLTVDIEYINDRTTCIGLGNEERGLVLPITHANGDAYWTPDHEVELWLLLYEVWQTHRLIGQNFSFDMAMLHKWLGLPKYFYFDTMVAHAVLYPGWKHNLAFLTSIYTTMPYYKDEMHGWTGSITDKSLWEYNKKDIVATTLCYKALLQELQDEKMADFYFNHQHKEIIPYLKMSLRGVRVDLPLKKKMQVEMQEKIQKSEKLLKDLVGKEVNVKSPKQVSELLYKTLGIKGHGTDKKQLTRLAARYAGTPVGSIVQAIVGIRHLYKIQSSYLEVPVSEDGRWHTFYGVTGTVSGRLSAKKWLDGSGLNLQTVPKSIRPLIIPDEGQVLFEIDLSSAEVRVVAWEGEAQRLKEFFRKGGDIHQMVADELGVSRQRAKATVHGSNYGMGPILFSEWVGLPVSQGKELQAKYFHLFPGVQKRMQDVRQRLRRREPYYNPFGRRLVYYGFINAEAERMHYSWFPQSTVGDIIHRTIIEIDQYPKLLTPLLNVHDSIVCECKPEDLDIAIDLVKTSMEQAILIHGDELSIPADVEVYEERWGKR